MEFEVYHAKPDKIKFGMRPRPVWPEDYDRVAVVQCENLKDVFLYTNHIDHSWQKNDEVSWFRGWQERSTSVDDVVIQNPPGQAFRCEMTGWSEIEASPKQPDDRCCCQYDETVCPIHN